MNHRRHSRSGAALIIVLVLVLLMGVAAAGFLLSMQTENIAARSSGDLLIAQAAATSGETMLGVLLEAPRQYRDSIGGLGDNPELFAKVAVVELGEDLDESEMATFTVIAPEYRARLQGTGGMSGMGLGLAVNDEALRYGGVDESNKIHLLKVLQWDQQIPGAGRAALLRIPGMTEETADSLLDWVDTDSETREFGAEDEYYSASGIQPRNGRPNSMRELLLVRGISSEAPPSWLSWLTIYSAHRDEAYDGAARVYVNDNNLARLQQSFAERVPLAWAQFVILYRQFGPAPTATDDEPVAPDAIPLDLSQPPRFRIESLIDLVDAKVALNHNGSRVWVASPLVSESVSMPEQLPQLLDRLTVTSVGRIEGAVNVNDAPREVLLMLPGIDEGLVERVIGARSMAGADDPARRTPAWLWTQSIVDRSTFRRLLPHINCGGDVYRAQFRGSLGGNLATDQYEAVIDAAGTAAQRVFVQTLEPFGSTRFVSRAQDPNQLNAE
jgi:hypothetical protein